MNYIYTVYIHYMSVVVINNILYLYYNIITYRMYICMYIYCIIYCKYIISNQNNQIYNYTDSKRITEYSKLSN